MSIEDEELINWFADQQLPQEPFRVHGYTSTESLNDAIALAVEMLQVESMNYLAARKNLLAIRAGLERLAA